jgi:acyl-CoA synthetase (AMP-forming)/AMP-acid ligase II
MLDVRGAMRRSAGFHRDLTAVISDGREYTYGQVWERGLRLANALRAEGLQPGDRVAVLEDNCLEAADFFVGSVAANLVRVPLYRRNSGEAHRNMLLGTGCRVVVTAPEYAHELKLAAAEIEDLKIIVRDSGYEEWLASFPADDPDPVIDLDDVFIIRHSAGTTGKAKGIAYTHRAWMCTERDWFYMLPPVDMGDRCLHVGPISHGSGYTFLPVWLAGGVNILDRAFAGEGFVERIRRDRVGYFFAVPTMLADIVARVGEQPQDLPDLKAIIVSAAPISERTARASHTVFGDTMFQLYGQTEAVPVAMMGSKDWFREMPGSDPIRAAGRILPFAELDIRDGENNPLPIGEEGEIAIRCDGQMTGIWGDDELSARRLIDGWVLTGDVGRMDQNGYLYVVDRVDDMIVSGGFNIWPAELEQAISSLPAVREVAVFGVPHDKWGEAPHAVVVVAPDADLDDATVIETCRSQLGSYKKPDKVEFRTDPLPRSPVGKIQRKVLREPYWAGEERRVRGS